MDFRFFLIPLITLPLGFITFLLTARAWQSQRQAGAARRWLPTTGQVIHSAVRQTTVRVRIGASTGRYRNAIRYHPQVIYQYTVNGTPYQAERLYLGPLILSSEAGDAKRKAVHYPAGSLVTVYYDPANPAEATLDPRTGWGTWILWFAALLMLVMTIAILILLWTALA